MMQKLLAFFCISVLICAPSVAGPSSTQTAHGPDTVMLQELVQMYEPVPFDHKAHAQMSEMWDGCTTCHHRSPEATTKPATTLADHAKTQADAAKVPACKSCHEISGKEADLLMPNLKGAYHRQCLNCHREWEGKNACQACHKERDRVAVTTGRSTTAPTVDDIVGRMHPPIDEPKEKVYVARFTPAMGSNVLFRHEEHTKTFGLKCVSCHRRDNCATCHAKGASAATIPAAERPVHPGRTWKDSHGPCAPCHANQSCTHCHYDPKTTPPPAFSHATTGQVLDKDHVNLKCLQCHTTLRSKQNLACGDSTCHASRTIAFPPDRPGPVVTTRPAIVQAVQAPAVTTQPTTKAVIKRIRR